MRFLTVAVALAGLLVAVPAAAVDRLVDDAGVPCMSGLPLHATIHDAAGAAAPGETILVCAGAYTENVTVGKANLTLRAQGVVHLTAANPALPGIAVTANGVTVQGFDVSGATSECALAALGNIDGADFRDNRLHGNDRGVCIEGGKDHRVRYNVVQNNNNIGIQVNSTTGPVDVSNNTVKGNDAVGILFLNCFAGGAAIAQNSLTGNGIGAFIVECDGASVTNNTVRGPGASILHSVGFAVFDSEDVVLTRNLVQNVARGVFLLNADFATASFNSSSFHVIGLDVVSTTGATVTRNNVSRSTTVDCRWDGTGVNVLTNNNCGTQQPAGAFD